MITERINTQEKDGDPRKIPFIKTVLRSHPEAVRIWREFELMERKHGSKPEAQVRKHGAPEHMIGGVANIRALGSLLVARGELITQNVLNAEKAYMVHDAGKPFEVPVIIEAMKDDVTWSAIEDNIKEVDLPNQDEVIEELRNEAEEYMNPKIDQGERIHVARDIVAGRVHKERLKAQGMNDEVIQLQGKTEYSSCADIDELLDDLPDLRNEERRKAITTLLVHWVDNGMMESVLTPLEERSKAVFQKTHNRLLSEAYRTWSGTGESAKEIQNRVGRRTEETLAKLVGVDHFRFLETVDLQLQNLILQASQS